MMNVISLGLGLQSTALYILSSRGDHDMPRADYAIFADPGAEHQHTKENLRTLRKWAENNNGIPIIVVETDMYQDLKKQKNSSGQRLASMPLFTRDPKTGEVGQLRRQCTREYKIEPIYQKIRQLHGLKKRQHMKPTRIWLGITIDEISRAKESPKYNCENYYPLLMAVQWRRSDCRKYMESLRYPIPGKSACRFCPFKSDDQWNKMNNKEFADAVDVDHLVRDMTKKGVNHPAYLHRSCKCLEDVDFDAQQDILGGECDEGYCFL